MSHQRYAPEWTVVCSMVPAASCTEVHKNVDLVVFPCACFGPPYDAHDVCMHNAAMPNDAVWPGFPAVAATGKIKL